MIVSQQPLIPGVSPPKKPLPVFNEPVWQLSLPCYPINLQLIGPMNAMNVEQRVKTAHFLNVQMHLNSCLNEQAGTRRRASVALLAERGHYCWGGCV